MNTKKIMWIAALSYVLTTLLARGQNCTDHAFFQQGKTLTYQSTDSAGNITATSTYIIAATTGSGKSMTSVVHYRLNNNTSSAEGDITCTCKGNKITIPNIGFGKTRKENITNNDTTVLIYFFKSSTPTEMPLVLQQNSKLKKYQVVFDMLLNGTPLTAEVIYDTRQVQGQESITITGQNYQAWKVSTWMTLLVYMDNVQVLKETLLQESYYDPYGFLLKEITYNSYGNISEYFELKTIQ